jgi:hypothetical protein
MNQKNTKQSKNRGRTGAKTKAKKPKKEIIHREGEERKPFCKKQKEERIGIPITFSARSSQKLRNQRRRGQGGTAGREGRAVEREQQSPAPSSSSSSAAPGKLLFPSLHFNYMLL